MEDPTSEDVKLLTDCYKLHPLVSEDLMTKATRVKVEEYGHYLFLVSYGLFLHKNGPELHEFDYVLGKMLTLFFFILVLIL